MRRRPIPDREKAGSSRVIPYDPSEGYRRRHARRYATNLQAQDDMRCWCEARGIRFVIGNCGHHWQFTLPGGKLIEWWPSSAKLVMNKRWGHGVHVHDYEQAQKIIEQELTGEGD